MIDTILSMINKAIPDKDAANKLALQLESEMTKQMKMKSDIIQAENKDGSGKWRPRLMYMCMLMIFTHWLLSSILPYFVIMFNLTTYLPNVPEMSSEVWTFLRPLSYFHSVPA